MLKVIIAAGGTGGHIYPALAIVKKIKEKDKKSEILYIGTTNRMEKDIVPKEGIDFVGLDMVGFNRKNILANFSVLKKTYKAYKKAKKVIKEFNPDIVIGAGGYVSAPVLYAAHKLGIKTAIHEQNSIPGMTNKFLANFVDEIFISLPGSSKYFPSSKVLLTGNPRGEAIATVRKTSKTNLGFSKDEKLVVIVMGSLGSTTITEKLKKIIPKFKNKNYQVLVITGNNYYDSYKDIKIPQNVKLVPFMENLINIMKDSSLLVSRAGASTISEITSIGLPSILVPSPYVTNNHQYLNAKELEEAGACKILEEKDFNPNNLINAIDSIFDDSAYYKKMKSSAKKIGINDGATRIYEEIRKLIGE